MLDHCLSKLKKFNIVLLWLLVITVGSLTAFAEENKITVSMDKTEYSKGDTITLSFNLKGSKSTSAFIIEAEYPEGISLSSVNKSSLLSGGYTEYSGSSNKVSFIYTYKDNSFLEPQDNILNFKFSVSENIEGENSIKISIKGALDENGGKLMPDSTGEIKFIANPPKEEVKVIKLIPSSGKLNPEFSPDIYEYTMSVPYSVSSITFDVEYEGEAKVSVNRKNLGSGGSTSDFIITVTPVDGEKMIYNVKVTRGEYVRPSSGGSKQTESKEEKDESKVSEAASEITIEENTDIIESTSQNSENKTLTAEVITDEPEGDIIINKSNGFTAFLFGAVTMIIGIAVGVTVMLIFRKIKK